MKKGDVVHHRSSMKTEAGRPQRLLSIQTQTGPNIALQAFHTINKILQVLALLKVLCLLTAHRIPRKEGAQGGTRTGDMWAQEQT